jgi:hypothetical protein
MLEKIEHQAHVQTGTLPHGETSPLLQHAERQAATRRLSFILSVHHGGEGSQHSIKIQNCPLQAHRNGSAQSARPSDPGLPVGVETRLTAQDSASSVQGLSTKVRRQHYAMTSLTTSAPVRKHAFGCCISECHALLKCSF